MIFKILFGLLMIILFEIVNLFQNGIMNHKIAYGMLKIILLNTLFISILALKSFYLNILIKIKEAVPPIVKTAAKIFETPIKSSNK